MLINNNIKLILSCGLSARHLLLFKHCQPVEGRLIVYLSVYLLYCNSWISVTGASTNSFSKLNLNNGSLNTYKGISCLLYWCQTSPSGQTSPTCRGEPPFLTWCQPKIHKSNIKKEKCRPATTPTTTPSRSGYPPWILKRAGLESSGRIASSSYWKTKRIAFFFFLLLLFLKKDNFLGFFEIFIFFDYL